MSEKVNCPFCGNLIEEGVYKCPNCDSLFNEPELKGLRFRDFGVFVALTVMTFGLFGTIWFFINAKTLNLLTGSKKDCIKFNWLIALLVLNLSVYIFYISNFSISKLLSLLVLLQIFIYIALTYRVLRIIQKYTKRTYNVELEFNPFYIAIFNILYLIHYIDTYTARVMQIHEYFNWKSPQMILLIIILLIIQFAACLDTNLHQFYKWLFRF